ncbi:class I SAM-dependent methyltransferase [Glycomyces sp. TRM65418]|uniref:class I SAM-dependent methyltransferase n=1 Tax=Glycomyces sp. TRM65418 TaxID=2867006 RepID=UPI001CE63C1C|nr:class I SAM-dependent methyltransferase [Glycomyces sp. TRM65418]MCC3763177.1 class I SAM-dependent methyltransferase [Glycomyces sp. TRM65418]QZD57182.1 class I SAM-dependent methyltransferase [Glycomyces sp. TRM65418]
MGATEWEWDETLFAGAAVHYGVGRMPYPASLAAALRDELGLDGTGRLLDVGCGPGSLTLLLAPLFATTVGVDADADMLAEARRQAEEAGTPAIEWRHLRGEDLPADLGVFDVVSFAQSFHWMNQPLVARRVRDMVAPGGVWVHIGATTHRGAATDAPLPRPSPPWERIDALVARYLGPVRRAGQGLLPNGTGGVEEAVMREAGYRGPGRIVIDEGRVVERGVDEVVAAVLSLSSSAPHLFAERLPAFVTDLRRLLGEAAFRGRFAERVVPIEAVVWRP